MAARAIHLAFLFIMLLCQPLLSQAQVVEGSSEAWQQIRHAIETMVADVTFDFGSASPRMIRLAAHAGMTYDPDDLTRPGGT